MKNHLKLHILVLTILTAIWITVSFNVKNLAQNGLQLQLPFNGIYQINSYVDHQTPYDRNTITDTIIIFNGQEYNDCPSSSGQWTTQGSYCYDGHEGIDWAMVTDTVVLASTSGSVVQTGVIPQQPLYGNVVIIDHGNGYETWYTHLLTYSVRVPDIVVANQEIARSGNSGNSSGPHLHFHVFHNNNITDPFGWQGNGSDPLINYSGETAVCLWANE